MACCADKIKQFMTANCSYVYQTFANLGFCGNPFSPCITTVYTAIAQEDNTIVYIQYYPPFNGELFVYVNGNQVALVPPNGVGSVVINAGDKLQLKTFQGFGGGTQVFITICSTAPLTNTPPPSGSSSLTTYILAGVVIAALLVAALLILKRRIRIA